MTTGEQVFGFFIPTVTLMSIGEHRELGGRIKTLEVAKKPLLATSKGITKVGLTEKIKDLIKKDTGIYAAVFDETVPNPTYKNVHDRVAVFKKYGCDMIITRDGGNPYDCGKGSQFPPEIGGRCSDPHSR